MRVKFKGKLATYSYPDRVYRKISVKGRPIGYDIRQIRIPPKGDGQFFDGLEITPISQSGKNAVTSFQIMSVDVPAFIKALREQNRGLSKGYPKKLPKGQRMIRMIQIQRIVTNEY